MSTPKSLVLLQIGLWILSVSCPLAQSQPIDSILDGMRATLFNTQESTEDPQPIKIIGAGLCRSGTSSLYRALEILGFKPYHMMRVLEQSDHSEMWAAVTQGEKTPQDAFEFLRDRGYNATLDLPTVDHWELQYRMYPMAKVILTVRDSPRAWVRSFRLLRKLEDLMNTRFSWRFPNPIAVFVPTKFEQMRQTRCNFGKELWGFGPCEWVETPRTDEWLEEHYELHLSKVQETIPEDQLLVYNVKEGWDPLCRFLEIDECPKDQPFPHLGGSRFLERGILACQIIVYGWIPFGLLVAFWHVRRLFRKCEATKEKTS